MTLHPRGRVRECNCRANMGREAVHEELIVLTIFIVDSEVAGSYVGVMGRATDSTR